MKCSFLFRTKQMMLIALAISLSNSIYAQTAVARTAASTINDDCSRAILLETKRMSTYSTFSMEGAGRSTNTYRSICEAPNEVQQAVWFQSLMPLSGKLNVYLQCENEMPRITVFYGECENLKYLACDVSSNVSSKMMTIIAKQLAEKPIFIRVATTNTLSKNFEIKVENPSLPSVSITDFSAVKSDAGVTCQWNCIAESPSFHSEIYHSSDGMNFTIISSEKGQDHSTHEQHYFIHEHPKKGDNFYRLVQKFENGVQRTVDEQLVIVDQINTKIRINPNLAKKRGIVNTTSSEKTTSRH